MRLRHKKGGLQISINAIVILILAITVLGIGLGFIRGMFQQTIGQLGEVSKDIENDMIDRLRDSNERLVLREENVEVKKGREKTIYFGVRNEEDMVGSAAISFNVLFECTDVMEDSGGDITHIDFNVFSKTKYLERDEITVMPAIIKVSPNAVATTYMCSALIDGGVYASKTFYITVTK